MSDFSVSRRVLSVSRRELFGAGAAAAALIAVPRVAHAAPGAVSVNASSFGFDAVDATDALQAALDSTADVVVIDDVGADWVIRPVFINRDHVTVVVAEGVTVRAKEGGYPGATDSMVTLSDRTGVTILGYGGELVMNKPEYTTGEWRMCIKVMSCTDLVIEGLTVRDSGGDGVYLGSSTVTKPNVNVTLRNVVADNHRRNCLSVISVDGLLVEGCAFTNARGTAPQGGVDFEPNYPQQQLSNIEFRDSVVTGNATVQMVIALSQFDATTTPISILIERVILGDQFYGSPSVMFSDGLTTPVRGEVTYRDVLVHTVATPHADKPGNLGFFRKSSESVHVTFDRCVLWNWGNPFFFYRPISISNARPTGKEPLPSYGAVTFTDTVLITDQEPPLFDAIEVGETSLTGVHGRIAVIGPETAEVNFGANPTDVDLTFDAFPASEHDGPLGAFVSLRPDHPVCRAGETAWLEFRRDGGLLSEPMAVEYTLSGTAVERTGLDGTAHVVIFGAGESSVSVPIHTRSVSDDPRPATIIAEVVPRPFYRTTGRPTAKITVRRAA